MSTIFTKILFFGDITPTGLQQLAKLTRHGWVISNFECALGGRSTSKEKAYTSIAGVAEMPRLNRSLERICVNIANNHVYDCGEHVFEQTLNRLNSLFPKRVFGYRENPYIVLEMGGRRIAVVGCLEKCRARGPAIFPQEDVTSILPELRRTYDMVVVYPHWGKESEYIKHATPEQQERTREWLGLGVDAVIGHHPHVAQESFLVGQRLVCYSLGNASFDHPEGKGYPGSTTGLVAVGDFSSADTPKWSVREFPQPISIPTTEDLDAWSTPVSQVRLNSAPIDPWWYWAKVNGSSYINKSDRAWAKRIAARPLIAIPLAALWNLLPRTILIRSAALLAKLCPPNSKS